MKIFECKCGSTEVFIEQSGNNIGLYCADCGKWITWLNKDQLRLAQRQIDNHDKQIRADVIDECIKALKSYGKCDLADKITLLEQLKEQK